MAFAEEVKASLEAGRTATVHWLEAIYNRQRRHSAIDPLSPADYGDRYWDRRAAA